ncbi:hypothetical protein P7C71_g5765, partial [Lecanoromycetidae sp. Uapishka_2]
MGLKKSTRMTILLETLGALVNGVFLLALCLSIFLEALQRLFEPQAVSNPKLILIVGCFGLASNIVGLFLFHEHGHSHGGDHGHSHDGADDLAVAEEGHGHSVIGGHTAAVADEGGNIADVLPQTTIAGWPESDGVTQSRREGSGSQDQSKKSSRTFSRSDEEDSTVANSTLSPVSTRKSGAVSTRRRRQGSAGSRNRFPSVEDLPIHPSSFRNEIIAASRENRLEDIESRDGSASDEEEVTEGRENQRPTENSPLFNRSKTNGSVNDAHDGHAHRYNAIDNSSLHAGHNHNKPKEGSGGGHSHSDLNMRGVFLHVMGDALGNVGVISSALFIWLTHYSWRFYADPVISLLITFIIFGSAWPLCKAASRILLQAVPEHISIDDLKEDIEDIPGILSCHDIHVWQLSGDKMVASLHIKVDFDFKGEGSARYMELAKAVRRCLRACGIQSTTLQPEFCLDPEHRHGSGSLSADEGSDNGKPNTASKGGSKAASTRSEAACLLECGDDCGSTGQRKASTGVEPSAHNREGHSH